LAIPLVASIIFLFDYLVNESGKGQVEVLKGDELHQMMDKFIVLFLPNVENLVTSFKHRQGNIRYLSNILAFKTNNGYDYIQNNYFLGQ
jgi:hypothetical protein